MSLTLGELRRFIPPSSVYLDTGMMLEVLGLQHKLNNAYNGDAWFNDKEFNLRFRAAAFNEMAEFLQEVNASWDWYSKRKGHFDREKALFELVDVAHFSFAALLMTGSLEKVQADVGRYLADYDSDQDLMLEIPKATLDSVFKQYDSFWRALEQFRVVGTAEGQSSFVGLASLRLSHFIAEGLSVLDYNRVDFMNAYRMKNARNFERVAGGVMRGVDVKATEKPLSLEAA